MKTQLVDPIGFNWSTRKGQVLTRGQKNNKKSFSDFFHFFIAFPRYAIDYSHEDILIDDENEHITARKKKTKKKNKN